MRFESDSCIYKFHFRGELIDMLFIKETKSSPAPMPLNNTKGTILSLHKNIEGFDCLDSPSRERQSLGVVCFSGVHRVTYPRTYNAFSGVPVAVRAITERTLQHRQNTSRIPSLHSAFCKVMI